MKKIIFFISSLNAGGAEKFLVYLANYLAKKNYIIKIIVLKRNGVFSKQLNKEIEIINLNNLKARYSYFSLIKVIKKEKPSFFYTIGGHLSIVVSFLIPLFRDVHFIARETSIPSKRNFSIIYRVLYRRLNKFNKIICISKAMKNDLITNFKIIDKKILNIPNVIDLELVEKRSYENQGLEKNKINLLIVGRLEEVKGINRAIDILSILIKNDENYFLNIVGDGKQRDFLIEYSRKIKVEKNIKFWGYQDNPYKFMKNSELVLVTSYSESFGNVVIEANQCGKYVIAYDSPGGLSEIIKNGKNGILVKDGDSETFAKEILKIKNKKNDEKEIKKEIEGYSLDMQLIKYCDYFDRD